ncbi:hypothetical protein [Paenibacillus gansuensis]|uniref:Uncharacterized protein n=1 Tax=Paenibacillus gansuensis TaxID=306542 RepID=A0ABW5PD32_9BACL
MMKYDSDYYSELTFINMEAEIEHRDGQWIDIYVRLTLDSAVPAPEEMEQLSAWVICNAGGNIVQIVALDAGCDTEYQFTPDEKRQLSAFVQTLDLN